MHSTYRRTDYEMFSKSGNLSVSRMVDRIVSEGESGKLLRPNLEATISSRLADIATWHREVYDTAVREIVYCEINRRLCEPQGWKEV